MNNKNITGADEMIAKIKAAQTYIEQAAPKLIGGLAVEHFKQSFENEGFTDSNLKKWDTRKAKSKLSKKVLTGQGGGDHLADSIKYRVQGNTVIISSDKVYAEIHNEGLEGKAWGKHKFTMPKRQFIGNSQQLNNEILTELDKDLTKILQ